MVETIPMSIYGSALLLLLGASMKPAPYPPVDAATGLDSFVDRASVELATNPDQWNAVWQRHKGVTPIGNTSNTRFPSAEVPPTIDFSQNEVLVLFGGLASEGGYEIVDSVKIPDKEITVKIHPLSLTGNGNSPSSFKANPYAFFVFPKTKLPFDIQTPYTDQSGTVQWKSIAHVGGKQAAPAPAQGR